MKTDVIHIAIADDYPVLVNGLKLLISAFPDCIVDIEAYDGLDLLQKIADAEVIPDICILDLSMPKMDGYEVLKRIGKEYPEIKVLILSMYHNEYSIIKTLREGAAGCLPKEVNPEEIHYAILEIITKGYYHTELASKYISASLNTDLKKNKINEREIEFLKYCCSDMSYQQIAVAMKLSARTIEGYRDNLFKKLEVKSRSALVMYAIRTGIMPINNILS